MSRDDDDLADVVPLHGIAPPVSPEGERWVDLHRTLLDYLDQVQPVDPRHNKRVAAAIKRLVQMWEHDEQAAR